MAGLAGAALCASPLAAQGVVRWHGYTQLRYGRADPLTGFTVRRAKLWMKGPVPGVAHLSFKVQGIFRDGASGAFVLQDVFADYGGPRAKVRVGQFVPAFSLERSQPDYLVPLIERAAVVETLIPGARTMGRDVGAQVFLAPGSGAVHLDVGLFDGSGANRPPGGEGDFLTTGRLVLSTDVGAGAKASLGGSLAWRRTLGTDVGVLSTAGSDFTGSDLRWGGDARLAGPGWAVQGEYLHSDLEGEASRGFYVLGDLAVSRRDEVALSVEQLKTPDPNVRREPWYIAGFTHRLGGGQSLVPGGAA
ncbi:MAG: porin, partial [Gemmatimonadota bacterium]